VIVATYGLGEKIDIGLKSLAFPVGRLLVLHAPRCTNRRCPAAIVRGGFEGLGLENGDEMSAATGAHSSHRLTEQRAAEAEQQRQAGIAIVAARLQKRVEVAKKLDSILREFEEVWHQLLDRSPVIANWPPGVSLPGSDALLDVKPLRDELAWRLFACGRPAWNRVCSVPQPRPALTVAGLEPKGLIGAAEAMGMGLLARIKAQRIEDHSDEEAA
jgi:hypothetical protein